MEGRGQRELGEQGVLGEQGGLGEQGEQLGLGEVLHMVVEVVEETTELRECGGAGGAGEEGGAGAAELELLELLLEPSCCGFDKVPGRLVIEETDSDIVMRRAERKGRPRGRSTRPPEGAPVLATSRRGTSAPPPPSAPPQAPSSSPSRSQR